MRAALRSLITSSGRPPGLKPHADAHSRAGIWYNARASRRCLGTCGCVGSYGLSSGPRKRAFTFCYVRALPVLRSWSSEYSVPVEDGAVGLLLELSAEEDGVEDDALGVDAADP